MEHDNMIGDPNQQTSPSVFRFDAYPGTSTVFPWDANNQEPKYSQNPAVQIPTSPIFSNFISPQQIPSPVAPQVPSSFCFGSQSSTSSMGGQFPFQITTHELGDTSFKRILGKRKTDSPPLQPPKQHISEEKMAEHMSRLHISSETVTSPLEPESIKNKRLYMCEEMRKLQAEPIIPSCLVTQVQRPCTALVLWQPPAKIMPLLDDQSESSDCSKEDVNKNIPCDNTTLRNLEPIEIDSEFVGNMDMDA